MDAQLLRKYGLLVLGFLLATVLVVKFFYSLVVFHVPLGYDPGLYRYLFITYKESLSSFSLPQLQPWAQEYPAGLFVLVYPLMLFGASPDALIGWIWNMVPLLLIGVYAWVIAKREGNSTAVALMGIALLSVAFYDGFFAMYYKVFVSLIFLVLTYHFAEKLSPWFLVTALLTVLIHQQSALVLVVSLGVWWVLSLPSRFSEKRFRRMTFALGVVAIAGLVWYIPQWERAIWSPLKSIFLLRGDNAPAGSFPEFFFFLKVQPLLLALGAVGFVRSFARERGSLWQISVLVCAVFIMFRLVFYRRFFLHLDFFLMPFAASALVWFFTVLRGKMNVVLLSILLASQSVMTVRAMGLRKPHFSAQQIQQIAELHSVLPKDASVIAMENVTGTWLRGWLPSFRVGAPGLFDYPNWTYEQWEMFIDGSQAERRSLLKTLDGQVFFLVTAPFTRFYGERAERVLNDPCLQPVEGAPLLRSICSSS